jgi:hypothetical protein
MAAIGLTGCADNKTAWLKHPTGENMPTEVTTSIEQVGQNLKGDFAVRTANHPEGGWITPTTQAGFAMAAAAFVSGKQLRITYDSYTSESRARRFYRGVSKIEFA